MIQEDVQSLKIELKKCQVRKAIVFCAIGQLFEVCLCLVL